MADGLSKVHGLFLQAIANNGVVPIPSGIEILEGIQDKCNTREFYWPRKNRNIIEHELLYLLLDGDAEVNITEKTLNEYIDTINEGIKNMQQNISFIRMDWNVPSTEYLVFCNTFNSSTTT